MPSRVTRSATGHCTGRAAGCSAAPARSTACSMSAATRPIMTARRRPNLRVLTRAVATRLVLDGRRCTGVVYRHKGGDHQVSAARAVIVSGGTVNSPHLLQISGIGPAAHLQPIGVAVTHDLPGV